MNKNTTACFTALGLLALVAASHGQGRPGAELTVLSGGAIEPGLRAAAAAFERESGHGVTITFNTSPQIRTRVNGGDTFSVVIAPPAVIGELEKAGKVEAAQVTVGRVGLGVVVRDAAPAPDISNADALRRAVLAADSLVFNRASTGLYFEGLLKKWGVYDQVEGKTTRYASGEEVLEHVLHGHGREVGFGAITEILLYRGKGVRYIGPLPEDAQNYTSYVAAPMTGGSAPDEARAFVQYLGSPAGKALFTAAGIE